MKTQRKKGFTMVELVIVIAVIAILAAVLIPTFVNLTKKANEAAALADARNIANQILADMLKGGGKDILVFEQKGDELYIHGYCAEAGRVLAYYGNPIKVSDLTGDTLADKVAAQLKIMAEKAEVQPAAVPSVGDWWHSDEMAKATAELGYSAETTVLRADYKIVPETFAKTEAPAAHTSCKDTLKKYPGQAADCGHAGWEAYWVCTVCGKIYGDEDANRELKNIEVTNPTYNHIYENGVCKVCGVKEPKDDGSSSGGYEKCSHTWNAGHVEKAATCGADGIRILTCTKCQIQRQEVIPATGDHTEVIDAAVPATCTTDGKTAGKHCSKCNTILVAQEIVQATGRHTPGEGDKCTSCGVTLDNPARDANATVVTDFTTLKNELEKSDKGSLTIRLGANIAMPKDGCITQNEGLVATLDLNGYTLTLYNSSYNGTNYGDTGFFVRGAMAIKDTSLAKCGKITAASTDNNGEGGLITVQKTGNKVIFGTSNNQFVLESGSIDATNNAKGCAIMMWHSGAVTINGGTVKAKGYAISGSTKDDSSWDRSRLIINGGSIVSEGSYAVYHPQYINIASSINELHRGRFYIKNGTLNGKTGAIYIGGNSANSVNATAGSTGSELVIENGQLISEGECVIFVDSTYLKDDKDEYKIRIRITGGSFKAGNAAVFAKVEMQKAVEKKTGGFWQGSQYCYFYLKGGTYNISQNKFVTRKNFTSTTESSVTTEQFTVTNKSSGYKATDPDANGVWSVVKK